MIHGTILLLQTHLVKPIKQGYDKCLSAHTNFAGNICIYLCGEIFLVICYKFAQPNLTHTAGELKIEQESPKFISPNEI